MTSEETKDRGGKTGCIDFGCKPDDFQKMFKMMGTCGSEEKGHTDCSAKMKKMMEFMKDKSCCGHTTEKSETGCTK